MKYVKTFDARIIAHKAWEIAAINAVKTIKHVDRAVGRDRVRAVQDAKLAWSAVEVAEVRLIHAIALEVIEREKIRTRLELQPGETRQ